MENRIPMRKYLKENQLMKEIAANLRGNLKIAPIIGSSEINANIISNKVTMKNTVFLTRLAEIITSFHQI